MSHIEFDDKQGGFIYPLNEQAGARTTSLFIYVRVGPLGVYKYRGKPSEPGDDYVVSFFEDSIYEGSSNLAKIKSEIAGKNACDIRLGYEAIKEKMPNLSLEEFNSCKSFIDSQRQPDSFFDNQLCNVM